MFRSIRAFALSIGLLMASVAAAKSPVAALTQKLEKETDFRVRVQAALELGKTYDERALEPLVQALDDGHASVRAAAAAALETLGDPRAVSALKQRRLDRSEAVRSQIRASLRALEGDASKPRVLVKLGILSNGTSVKSAAVERHVLSESRRKLDALPGVDVLPNDDDGGARGDVPVVLVTPSIQRLVATRDGDSVVYSARVEYILHSMPDEAIAARLSGSASATATERDAQDKSKSAELRRAVIEAAVQSALRRAPPALMAAARR